MLTKLHENLGFVYAGLFSQWEIQYPGNLYFFGGRMVLKQIQEAPLLATEMLQVAEIVGQLVLNTAWGLCKDGEWGNGGMGCVD